MTVRMTAEEFRKHIASGADTVKEKVKPQDGKHLPPDEKKFWTPWKRKLTGWALIFVTGFGMGSESPADPMAIGCFEDQVVVQVVSEWDRDGFEPVDGPFLCISRDNFEGLDRP